MMHPGIETGAKAGTGIHIGEGAPLLRVENLVVEYSIGGKTVHAVSGVSFAVARGETLGLVGESGCGKSTLARAVLQLSKVTSGQVLFDGVDLTTMHGSALRSMRRRLQIIFQDPIASLNPRRRVGDIIAEPLLIAGVGDKAERETRMRKVLTAVGLDPDLTMGRFVHEFSGGQCQRVCIARALILERELIVCDEPVSSLDVSIRAQIINLLEDMKARYGLTLLFIAHDLAVVKAVSDRVAVMYLGRLCEAAPTEHIPQSEPPLHGAAVGGDPSARSRCHVARQRPGRRAAITDHAAERMPVSHPVLPCRRALQRRRAGCSRNRPAPVRRLSLPVAQKNLIAS
jgi:peptide/nickel transport system ATP-binding protein